MTVVIEQDVIDAMNERQGKVAQLIADAEKDPVLDKEAVIDMLTCFSSELNSYIYGGNNLRLQEKMDDEKITNGNGFRDLINGETYLEFPVYNVILERLN